MERNSIEVTHPSSSTAKYRRPKVSRITARSANLDMHLSLDVNIELYPLAKDEKIAMVLATSLSAVGEGEEEGGDQSTWRPDIQQRRGLDNDYDYVMHGKVRDSYNQHE
jgi:DNA-directed RNA polymerases I, II, and III subunit RPABC3